MIGSCGSYAEHAIVTADQLVHAFLDQVDADALGSREQRHHEPAIVDGVVGADVQSAAYARIEHRL